MMKTRKNAKRVLVYGDSIAFGHIGRGPVRIHDRFPIVMQDALGDDYEIIEAALSGRTVSGENPYGKYRDGLASFGSIYGMYMPLGLVAIMLGTNDANDRLHKSPADIANGLREYVKIMGQWHKEKGFAIPETFIISPPPVAEESLAPDETMYRGAGEITRALPPYYQSVAYDCGAHFFDAGSVVSTSEADGVHLNEAGHRKLGTILAREVSIIFDSIEVPTPT